MRSRVPVLAACLLSSLLSASALADPIQPPVADAFGWADGEARRFSLTWNGTQAAFSVDQVGSSTYGSLETCCDDVFSRIRDLNPGGSLLFNGLALNTMPISTSFVDGLNLELLKSQTHNIATLTGYVTLQLPPDLRRGRAVLDFTPLAAPGPDMLFARPGSASRIADVPEPATLLLIGTGLVGLARLVRKRG